ncbi:MAG: hypothetical protein Q9167_000031 [Letrouitia subvulpina]
MAHHVPKRRKIDRQPFQKDANANAEQAPSDDRPERNSAKIASSRHDSRVAEATAGRPFGHSVNHPNLRYTRQHASVTSSKSNFMRLEIDELLSKLESESHNSIASVETALSQLRIRVPSPTLIPNGTINYSVAYDKPESINTIGSYARKTARLLNGVMTVDVCVTMPSTKAEALLDEQNEHLLEPPLVFRILLAVNEGLFAQEKTVLWKCCIFDDAKKNLPNSTSAEPTSFYNATLRSENCALSYLAHFGHSSLQTEAFHGASMLGDVWLRQRGFGSSLNDGGIGQFEWCLMMSMLMKRGGHNGDSLSMQRHNDFQLFKAMLQFLAGRDLISNPLFINERDPEINHDGVPVFFDGDRALSSNTKPAYHYKLSATLL